MKFLIIFLYFIFSLSTIGCEPSNNSTTRKPIIIKPSSSKQNQEQSQLKKCNSDFLIDLNRIYGGQDASKMEFPHQGSLQVRFFDSHVCGATLITNRWVLTAAHCFSRSRYPFNWQIKLGEHNLWKNDSTERTFRVEKLIIHEKYDTKIQLFDIALLKLAKPVNLTGLDKHIKTVCLAKPSDIPKDNYVCMATGWGRGNKGRVITDVLQKLPQPIHNSTKCSKIWKKATWPITKDHICIGDLKGGKGVCNGDSGGPVQCKLRNGEWVQFGIASWTINNCVEKGFAAVFTKVSSYLSWIEQQINKNK